MGEAVIARYRDEIDVLRETVRQLREALAPAHRFPLSWRLTAQEERLLSAVMESRYGSGVPMRGGLKETRYSEAASQGWQAGARVGLDRGVGGGGEPRALQITGRRS